LLLTRAAAVPFTKRISRTSSGAAISLRFAANFSQSFLRIGNRFANLQKISAVQEQYILGVEFYAQCGKIKAVQASLRAFTQVTSHWRHRFD
jgi:hypothetical protein